MSFDVLVSMDAEGNGAELRWVTDGNYGGKIRLVSFCNASKYTAP